MKCNYCGSELINGNIYCLNCGRKNEKELNKEEVELELANEKKQSNKKKMLTIGSVILVLILCCIGFSYIGFSVKARNISSSYIEMNKEQTEQYFNSGNSIVISMAKSRINKDVKKISKDYMTEKSYDSDFYNRISNILEFDKNYEVINVETIENLPTLEYVFSEMIYDISAESVVKYIDSLERFSISNPEIKENVQTIYDSYLEFSNAEIEYNNGEYVKALGICNKIKVHESDADLAAKVKQMIADISIQYSEVISQNLVDSFEAGQYSNLFELLENLKEINQTEYEKYYSEYISKCVTKLDELMQNGLYKESYDLAIALYGQKKNEYSDKLLLCYEQYTNYLVNEAESEDTAKEITTEMMKSFPDNETVINFNNYFNLEEWKKEYKKILGNSSETSKFSLYRSGENEIPFLLKLDDSTLTVYGMDGDNCNELAYLDGVISGADNEYVTNNNNTSSGYFEKTNYDYYYVYEVTSTGEIAQKNVFCEEYGYQYYAFTNQKYNEHYTYTKDGESISESEYNENIEKINYEYNGFNDITEENIQNVIVNYQ